MSRALRDQWCILCSCCYAACFSLALLSRSFLFWVFMLYALVSFYFFVIFCFFVLCICIICASLWALLRWTWTSASLLLLLLRSSSFFSFTAPLRRNERHTTADSINNTKLNWTELKKPISEPQRMLVNFEFRILFLRIAREARMAMRCDHTLPISLSLSFLLSLATFFLPVI